MLNADGSESSENFEEQATIIESNVVDGTAGAPMCPNSLKAVQYEDGRPVMCLPGRNQCPANSVCYFNGMDFYCCPNAEDPYDEHVFGGNNSTVTVAGC